ncbi:MAG: starch-binding protein, partial [Bacteroidales bacterium]|nr:starch-binding protein [Bacteroidales bacterium]
TGYYDIYLYPSLAKAKLVDAGPEYQNPEDNPGDDPGDEPGDDPGDNPGDEPGDNPGTGDTTEAGPTVYVYNASTWTYVYLYAWADGIGDIETAWPGHMPDDVAQVGEYSYYKYNLSSAWSAGQVNLIFNQGPDGSGQTAYFPISMQPETDYFFYVSPSKAYVISDPNNWQESDFWEDNPGQGSNDEIIPGTDPTASWSVIGTIMGSNWDKDFVMTMTDIGVWEVDITYNRGEEFKLRYYGSWDSNVGMWKSDPNDEMDIAYDYGLCGNPDESKNIKLNTSGKVRLKYTTSDNKLYVTVKE